MKKLSGLKRNILIAVLVVAVFVVAVFALVRVYAADRVEKQLSLGEKYLNTSDYNAAILAYQQALEIEPANTEAIVGLAQAYNSVGDSEFALELLEQLGGESRDPAVQQMEAAIHEENGNIGKAISIIEKLIEMTDKDEYYEKLEELIVKKLSSAHLYGNSGNHEAVISAGQLLTKGMNVTGQLGTRMGLNRYDYVQTMFKDASFSGKARAVYCFAQNTYVVDEAGDLWVAGTNRSGQEVNGSSTVVTECGWRRVPNMDKVAHVTGGNGYVVVLRQDGTLWYAGQNFGHTGAVSLWDPKFVQISSLGTVVQVESTDSALYVLNSAGELYCSYHSSGEVSANWNRYAKAVRCFSADSNSVYWLSDEGWIRGDIYSTSVSYPYDWQTTGDDYGNACIPSMNLQVLAANSNAMLLLDTDGTLYYLGGNGLDVIDESGDVGTIYQENGYLVAQWSDGRVCWWDAYGNRTDLSNMEIDTTPDAETEPETEPEAEPETEFDMVMDWRDANLEAAMRDVTGIREGDIMYSDVKDLTYLFLADYGISDISALGSLTNLESLLLYNNSISDISALSSLTNLKELYLWENSISDISALSGLTNLTKLYLDQNEISDISSLAELTNLVELSLFDNMISDITSLSNLTNLMKLSLTKNAISDISALSGMTNLADLSFGANNVSDISILSGLTNLSQLSIEENGLEDISALSGLSGLTELTLYGNEISDISALSDLVNLNFLYLSQNRISDVSSLSGLINLGQLYINGNEISDISALSGLVGLTVLDLTANEISDVSALSDMVNLTRLQLSENQISDISALSGMKNLNELNLSENAISELSSLSGLTALELLFMDANEISDVSSLGGLMNLTILRLNDNPISDVSALSSLTNLQFLFLQGCPVTDLSPVSFVPELYVD